MLETFQTNDYSFEDYNSLNDNLLYLDYIKNNYEFDMIAIEPAVAYRNKGNFIGLLQDLKIETNLYVYTQYINGYNSPLDFDGTAKSLLLPIIPPIPPR